MQPLVIAKRRHHKRYFGKRRDMKNWRLNELLTGIPANEMKEFYLAVRHLEKYWLEIFFRIMTVNGRAIIQTTCLGFIQQLMTFGCKHHRIFKKLSRDQVKYNRTKLVVDSPYRLIVFAIGAAIRVSAPARGRSMDSVQVQQRPQRKPPQIHFRTPIADRSVSIVPVGHLLRFVADVGAARLVVGFPCVRSWFVQSWLSLPRHRASALLRTL